MTQKNILRLQHLLRVAEKEANYLQKTTQHLSVEVINENWVAELEQ